MGEQIEIYAILAPQKYSKSLFRPGDRTEIVLNFLNPNLAISHWIFPLKFFCRGIDQQTE